MSEDTDPTTPDDDAHEYDTEPVTLGEAEEALVFALAGVSQIADILADTCSCTKRTLASTPAI